MARVWNECFFPKKFPVCWTLVVSVLALRQYICLKDCANQIMFISMAKMYSFVCLQNDYWWLSYWCLIYLVDLCTQGVNLSFFNLDSSCQHQVDVRVLWWRSVYFEKSHSLAILQNFTQLFSNFNSIGAYIPLTSTNNEASLFAWSFSTF